MTQHHWLPLGTGGVLLLLAIGSGAWAHSVHEDLIRQRKANAELAAQNAALAQEAQLETELLAELETLRTNVGAYVGILPAPEVATEEALMRRVSEHAERSNVVFTRWNQATLASRGRASRRRATFTEVPLELHLAGTHRDLLRFVNRLEREASLIRVNSFVLKPQRTENTTAGDPLNLTLRVSTFRYDAGA